LCSSLGYFLRNGVSSTGVERLFRGFGLYACGKAAPSSPSPKNAWRNEACVSGRLESRRTRASQLLVCRHDILMILFRSLCGGSLKTGGPAVRIQAGSIRPAHSPGLIFVAGRIESTCTAGEHRFENQISESEFRSSLGRLRVAKVFRFQQPFAAFLSQFSAIAKPCSVDSTGESLKTDRG
jgi:hypothetical protein